jgi:hypothetical protein
LEDTIANMANFVTSGSIQRIQSTIIGINNITPQRRQELRAMASRASTDLSDLSNNIDTVDQWLNGLGDTVQVMKDRIPMFNVWFSPEGVAAYDRTMKIGDALSHVLPSLGSIYTGGYWAVPFINSMGIALGAVQKSKWAVEAEYRPWQKLFTEMFLPADKYPAMNIISVQTPDGRVITENVENVLRMLGAVP